MMPVAYGVTTTALTTVDVTALVDKPKLVKWIVISPIDGSHEVTVTGNGAAHITEGVTPGESMMELSEGRNIIRIWFTIPSENTKDLYVIDLFMKEPEKHEGQGTHIKQAAKKIFHITPVFSDEPPKIIEQSPAEPSRIEEPVVEEPVVEEQIITPTPKEHIILLEDKISITDDIIIKLDTSEAMQKEKPKPEIIAETLQEKTKVLPPLKQIKSGVMPSDVSCTGDRLLRITITDKPYCILPDTFEILKQRGLGLCKLSFWH